MFQFVSTACIWFCIVGDVSTQVALQPALKFNGGGHINHTIFWTNLSPNGGGEPQGKSKGDEKNMKKHGARFWYHHPITTVSVSPPRRRADGGHQAGLWLFWEDEREDVGRHRGSAGLRLGLAGLQQGQWETVCCCLCEPGSSAGNHRSVTKRARFTYSSIFTQCALEIRRQFLSLVLRSHPSSWYRRLGACLLPTVQERATGLRQGHLERYQLGERQRASPGCQKVDPSPQKKKKSPQKSNTLTCTWSNCNCK